MRVTHYLQHVNLAHGGICRAVLDLCTWQARAGASVTLLTFDPKDCPRAWKDGAPGAPRVITAPRPRGWRSVLRSSMADTAALLRESDVLHMHDVWDPVQIPLSKLALDVGRPYVLSTHGLLSDWPMSQKPAKKRAYLTLLARRMIDRAAMMVLTAEGELEQTRKRHPRTPGCVIPLVFDLEPYRGQPSPDPARRGLALPAVSGPLLLYLGRIDYKKRPDLLLASARDLRDAGHDVGVVMAGPGDAQYVEQVKGLARSLGIERVAFFPGLVTDLRDSLFAACDLFVLPSSQENFGFACFEALACGLPLVTTRATDTWRELEASGGAHIIDPIPCRVREGQVSAAGAGELTAAMSALIRDRERMRAMGRSGRAWVLQNMDPSATTARYLEMYRSVAPSAA